MIKKVFLLILLSMMYNGSQSFIFAKETSLVDRPVYNQNKILKEISKKVHNKNFESEIVSIELTTDNWANESSWNIWCDNDSGYYYSGNQVFDENSTTYYYTVELDTGVYSIHTWDIHGDGGIEGEVRNSDDEILVEWDHHDYQFEGAFGFVLGELSYSVNPSSIYETLATDETIVIPVSITNTGSLPFDYTIYNDMIEPVQFSFDHILASGEIHGQTACATDGEYIYSTVYWDSADIIKYDLDGNYIETFVVPGAMFLRNLTYDGTYFYGANAGDYINGVGGCRIFKMDFDTKELIDTIFYTSDGSDDNSTRSISYDESRDAFWVNNWSSNLRLIDRTGNELDVITDIETCFDVVYDNISEGGPYIWVHTTGDASQGFNPLELVQYDIATKTKTGIRYKGYAKSNGDAVAGGVSLTNAFIEDEYTFLTMLQTESISGIALDGGFYWGEITNDVGRIEVGETAEIDVILDPSEYDVDSFNERSFTIKGQAGTTSLDIEIPVTLIVNSVDIEDNYELAITNYELKQNYPNPFNPHTRINYELASTNYELAEIVVYNAMGQIVGAYPCGRPALGTINQGSILFDGSKLNSGIYYYSLIVDNKQLEKKKMILLK